MGDLACLTCLTGVLAAWAHDINVLKRSTELYYHKKESRTTAKQVTVEVLKSPTVVKPRKARRGFTPPAQNWHQKTKGSRRNVDIY